MGPPPESTGTVVVALAGAGAPVVGRSLVLGVPGGGGGEGCRAGVPGGGDVIGGGESRTPSAGQTAAHCAWSTVLLPDATVVVRPVCDISSTLGGVIGDGSMVARLLALHCKTSSGLILQQQGPHGVDHASSRSLADERA